MLFRVAFKFIKCLIFLCVLASLAMLLVSGCARGPLQSSSALTGEVTVSITFPRSVLETLEAVEVIISAADMDTMLRSLTVQDSVASGKISYIPAGYDRVITINAYQTGGILSHTGSETIDIAPSQTVDVVIFLEASTGNANIQAFIGQVVLQEDFESPVGGWATGWVPRFNALTFPAMNCIVNAESAGSTLFNAHSGYGAVQLYGTQSWHSHVYYDLPVTGTYLLIEAYLCAPGDMQGGIALNLSPGYSESGDSGFYLVRLLPSGEINLTGIGAVGNWNAYEWHHFKTKVVPVSSSELTIYYWVDGVEYVVQVAPGFDPTTGADRMRYSSIVLTGGSVAGYDTGWVDDLRVISAPPL